MWTRQELKSKAKITLKQVYWTAVFATVVLSILYATGSSSSNQAAQKSNLDLEATLNGFTGVEWGILFGMLATIVAISVIIDIFVINPMAVGCYRVFAKAGYEETNWKDVFFVFKSGSYLNVVKVMFLYNLFAFLWTLLFIIPGIIKSLEYEMIPFLLAEDPAMPSEEAFATTKKMMDGQKWNAFVLDLSFILWDILASFTAGILEIFYVGPYRHLTEAQLYHTLKGDAQ